VVSSRGAFAPYPREGILDVLERGSIIQANTVAPGYSEPGHSESLAVMNGEGRKIRAPPDLVCYSEKKPCSVLNGAIGHQQG